MLGLMFALLASAADKPRAPDPVITRMAALYEEVCLNAFPYDDQIDAIMAAKGAKALTPDEVKVTLRDDPGRAWIIEDEGRTIQITLELPPYHACSVRRMTTGGLTDPAPYRAVIDRFKLTRPGFVPSERFDRDLDGLHIQATTEQRPLTGGASETLMIFEQRVADPKRVANGETMVNLRFVHQIR